MPEAGHSRPLRHVVTHFTHVSNLPGILAAGLRADARIMDEGGSLLVTTVESISAAGLRSLFSDGNCAKAITVMYDDLSWLDAVIDWPVMRARMWNDTAEDPDRMRRRMAEFLVHERVPVTCLAGIAVRTEPMWEQVAGILGARGQAAGAGPAGLVLLSVVPVLYA